MKTKISASPIMIDTVSGCSLTVKITYQSDNLEEMKKLEEKIRSEIGFMLVVDRKDGKL